MNATVIYPRTKTFEVPIPPSNDIFLDAALNAVWQECQGGIEEILGRPTELDKMNANGAQLRSSMVGDIISIQGRYFIVAAVGFIEVNMEVAERWQGLPWQDIMMGWDYCCKYHNLGNPINVIK